MVCLTQSVSSLFSRPSSCSRYWTRVQTSVWLRAKKEPTNAIVRGYDKPRYIFRSTLEIYMYIRGFHRYVHYLWPGGFYSVEEDSFCEQFVFSTYEYFMRIFRIEIRTRVSRLRRRLPSDEIVDSDMFVCVNVSFSAYIHIRRNLFS